MTENQWIARASKDNAIALATRAPVTTSRNKLALLTASFSAAATKLLQVYSGDDNSVLVKSTLAIDAVPEKFKTTTTTYYSIAGASYAKTAVTALTFSAAHVITATKYGVVLIQIDAAGTISTKVPAANQAYASAAAALAALPSADAANIALGYIAIHAGALDWTANTDDMTNGSDVATASFNDATETGTLVYEDYVVNSLVVPFRYGLGGERANKSVVAVLAASGAGGTVGKVNIIGYST